MVTTEEAAARLLAQGLPIIPLDSGKRCRTAGWKTRQFDAADFARKNIGLRLEGDLVDVDLDCEESRLLASFILPPTATFGHTLKSSPSHALYRLTDPESCTGRVNLAGLGRKGYNVKMDLRCTEFGVPAKFYTMIPPSVHPDTQEPLQWLTSPEEPALISWRELKAHFIVLATASEFMRLYKMLDGLSGHHDICLHVAGAMRSCEWPQELAAGVFEAVMQALGEPDAFDRMQCLTSTYTLNAPTGIPTMDNTLAELAPESRFISLLEHADLPFKRSVPKDLPACDKRVLAAKALDVSTGSLTDADLSLLLKEVAPDLVRYNRSWYLYNKKETSWEELADDPLNIVIRVADALQHELETKDLFEDIRKVVRAVVAYCKSTKGAISVLKQAQSILLRKPTQLPENHIRTKSHTINLDTGEAVPFNALEEFVLEKPMPIEYDPKATCPLWEETVAECLLHDEERIRAFQQSLGMTFASQGKEEKVIIWYGKNGNNGKSTITRVLREVFGEEKVVRLDEKILTGRGHPSAGIKLIDSRMAYISEFKNQFNAGMIKMMSGGDYITAHRMFKGAEEVRPTWTVHLMTNKFPHFNKLDAAVTRRMFVIPWLASFAGEARDVSKERRMPLEASGILNWMIRGYQDWRAAGALQMCSLGQEMLGESLRDMDVLGEFLEEVVEFDPESKAKPKELFRRWMYHLEDANIKEHWTRNRFYHEFSERTNIPRKMHDGYQYFAGIKIRKEGSI